MVRAKFICWAIQHLHTASPDYICAEITFKAVWSGGGEDDPNKTWSKQTPNGEIKMTITNQAAINAFELGKNYHIDFESVD